MLYTNNLAPSTKPGAFDETSPRIQPQDLPDGPGSPKGAKGARLPSTGDDGAFDDKTPSRIATLAETEPAEAPNAPADGDGVPAGWSAEAWADHLRRLGERCEHLNPGRAAEYVRQAERIKAGRFRRAVG